MGYQKSDPSGTLIKYELKLQGQQIRLKISIWYLLSVPQALYRSRNNVFRRVLTNLNKADYLDY